MSDFKAIQTEIEKEVDKKTSEDVEQFYKDFVKFLKESSKKYPHLDKITEIGLYFKDQYRDNAPLEYIGKIKFRGSTYSTLEYSDRFISFFTRKLKIHYLRTYLTSLRETIWR